MLFFIVLGRIRLNRINSYIRERMGSVLGRRMGWVLGRWILLVGMWLLLDHHQEVLVLRIELGLSYRRVVFRMMMRLMSLELVIEKYLEIFIINGWIKRINSRLIWKGIKYFIWVIQSNKLINLKSINIIRIKTNIEICIIVITIKI